MNAQIKTKEELLAIATRALYNTELLIQQCDRWFPEEEYVKDTKKIKRQN